MVKRWFVALAAFFLAGLPTLAQETTLWVGPAVGNIRKHDRRAYGSLEIRKAFLTSGRWSWQGGAVLEADSVENYAGAVLSLS